MTVSIPTGPEPEAAAGAEGRAGAGGKKQEGKAKEGYAAPPADIDPLLEKPRYQKVKDLNSGGSRTKQ